MNKEYPTNLEHIDSLGFIDLRLLFYRFQEWLYIPIVVPHQEIFHRPHPLLFPYLLTVLILLFGDILPLLK